MLQQSELLLIYTSVWIADALMLGQLNQTRLSVS